MLEHFSMDIGIVRDLPRLTADTQLNALRDFGVMSEFIWIVTSDGQTTMADVLDSLRPTDRVVVFRGVVLAEPKRKTSDRPRDTLRAAIKGIKAAGATVYEIETDRDCSDPDVAVDLVFDAVDRLSSNTRGRGRPGRPTKFNPSDASISAAKTEWFNLNNETNDDAVEAMPEGWTFQRAYKKFGKSGRGSM